MKSNKMEYYFNLMDSQRNDFYHKAIELVAEPWERPLPEKWSVNETMYHLILMVRLVRRASTFYLPIMVPYGYLRKNQPYKKSTYNIYEEYGHIKRQPMNAPFVLTPPSKIHKKYNLDELQQLLSLETEKLKNKLSNLNEKVAGQIRYPDPIAHYPNVIQSVHLIAIHEQHHFNLTLEYERQKTGSLGE